ncbi:dehydrogenase/reductase SDR family member 4-like [Cochliomyia hominivorax]
MQTTFCLFSNQYMPRFTSAISYSNAYNMKRLQGKVAVVTASTDGIGLSIAKRFVQEGAKVVISSRKKDNVDRAVDELRKLNLNVLGLKCHVSEAQDRKQLFEETIRKYGKLNILVSNAAINPSIGAVLDCEEKAWDKIFDVNLKSSFLLAKEALPHLRKEQNSNIVFVSSITGYDAYPDLGVYSISKTALFGLTKAVAKDLGPEGIRVNCLAPGFIKTKFSKFLYEDKDALTKVLLKIPLHRLGMPDEMAGAASFLVSDDASYITGETIVAAGGMVGRL